MSLQTLEQALLSEALPRERASRNGADMNSNEPPYEVERIWNEIKAKIEPWMVGIALLAIGYFLLRWWKRIEIVSPIAEAILIAGILTLFVDPFLKGRIVKEASKGIFHWLLGFHQPAKIQERLQRLVTRERLIRRNFKLNCELCRSNGHILLKCEYEFEVFNPSNETEKYVQEIDFEPSENPQVGRLVFISAHDSNENYDRAGGPYRLKPDDPWVHSWKGPEVSISPKLDGYHFSGTYSLEYSEEDFHSQVFGRTTDGLTLSVKHPEDLEVTASYTPYHSGGVWRYDRLFMQEEHVNIRWKPKPLQAAQPT